MERSKATAELLVHPGRGSNALRGRICHGAMPRKFEPGRWRSSTDAGEPRKRLANESCVPVPSINDLSGQCPQSLKQKPTPHNLANDLALLNHAAYLADDNVFIVTDDTADYFLHLSLAPT
eukprot:6178624-Pleurochrysis_carterae.AAC.4